MGTSENHRDDPEEVAPLKSILRDYVETILVCVIFVIFVRAFVFQQSEIPSGSMEDTILIGDYVLVNRFLYAPTSFDWERAVLPTRDVRRGDVVVFKHPGEPEQDFIKRVIGLPGETIEVRNGTVWIDQRPLEEPYVNPLYAPPGRFGPIEIAAEDFFLMGDHRNHSSDSRSWGTVPRNLLKGRAFLILFSTRGASTPGDDPGRVTPISLVKKIYNLAFRSRWDRTLRPLR